ncbi:MAG: alpha-L-fucosidase [Fimbriimonas sp.]
MLPLLLMTALAAEDIKPLPPIPHPRQLAWQKMQQYAFVHFGPNTFTDVEWGEGKEDPKLFNPTALDCGQWARTAKAAGLTGIIITAKHHDGFCLWPSKYSTHTVAQSLYKGDVLRELSNACKKEGLKMGVYLSPWDRNHPSYGTPEYNQVFANMLREVLTSYGPIFEVWFDGANGEGPNGKKQVYDWPLFVNTVRKYQPNAVIFSDAGPDIRWVGNESGHSDPECWSTIDRDRYVAGTPLYQELTKGKRGGKDWVPAECDVSIRPGWFYHKEQDGQVKSPETLMKLWEESVGQNGSFLLNVPPDRRGLWHENDVMALLGWKKLLDEVYGKPLNVAAAFSGPADPGDSALVNVTLSKPRIFDRVELREPIGLGQRIAGFRIEALVDEKWTVLSNQTTVGNRRIVRVPRTKSDRIRIVITDSLAEPLLTSVILYWTGR